MITLLLRARNGLFVTAIGLMLLSLLAPAVTLADTSLTPGSTAVVAGTNGDGVALRSDMNTASQVLQTVPEGTPLQILDGPLTAADGSVWYSVSANGTTGYVAAAFVSSAAGSNTNTDSAAAGGNTSAAATDAATQAPTQAPQAPVSGPAASTIPWKQAIGYGVVNDNIGQGVPQIGIVCRADVNAEAAKITQVYLGDTIEITGPQIQSEGLSWLPVNCAGVGGFIDASFISVASNQGAQAQATEAPADVATQVPTEVVTEAPTQAPATVETAAPTQPPVTDTQVNPTEVATQAPAGTQQVTPAVAVTATVTATEAPAQTQPATEMAATQAAATPTTTAPADDKGAQPTTATADSTPAATANATESAATATAQATQPSDATVPATVTATASATAEATEAPTQAATQASTPETEQPATGSTATATAVATQDASATATPGVDLSQAIGTAVVQGADGDGVRCRVAPADDAATITILTEGTKVMVMGMPSNGWLPVACADQVGYTNVQYMWQGGAVQGDFSGNDKGGSVTVQGTGGGLNCRSGAGTNYPVIAVLPDGTSLVIRDQPSGGWLPVVCAGQNGYVFLQYVSSPQSASGNNNGNGSSRDTSGGTGTVTVTGTNGDGLRCRASASPSGAVIIVLPDGTQVATRGTAANGWLPVVCAGQNGYISTQYASVGGGSGSGNGTGNTSGGGATAGGTVTVTGTGTGLNCRSDASLSASVITVVFDGTVLTVRGAAANGWLPVVCASQNGYVSTSYVTSNGGGSGNGTGSNTGGGSNSGGSDTGSGSPVTGTATVSGTNGDGVRCRASASTSGAIITVVAEGQSVSLRGDAANGWQPVVCGGQNGYIYAQYLTTGSGSGNSGSGDPGSGSNSGGGSASGLINGDHAQTTDVINLRYQPSLGSGVATTAPAGTVVLITGSIDSGFYPVDWDGLKGYMSGDYLVKTDAALSQRGGSANDGGSGGGPTTGGGGSTATGNAIVDYAMGYLGYPYVWATHGPSSFDCSGFTYWVILHVLGIDIGTGLWTQVNGGTPVSSSALQPGDLVFFQNTYEAGLSHVGIYIGNGQFIHAENETTGVKISDLSSTYYSSRWYGAVRYS